MLLVNRQCLPVFDELRTKWITTTDMIHDIRQFRFGESDFIKIRLSAVSIMLTSSYRKLDARSWTLAMERLCMSILCRPICICICVSFILNVVMFYIRVGP